VTIEYLKVSDVNKVVAKYNYLRGDIKSIELEPAIKEPIVYGIIDPDRLLGKEL
jgi:hypothetical protein